jgi:glycosyltransferase involved in cell wall biosynthesis
MSQTLSVCIISKFPPIQGGMAARAYWLARGLSEDGIDVTVLTNNNVVEKEHSISNCIVDSNPCLDIKCMELNYQLIIPQRHYDIAGFIESFLRITRAKKIDVIDAQYLVPYGIVAYLINKICSIPYIIRHGGSDIDKILKNGIYEELLLKVIFNASVVDSLDEFIQTKSQKFVRFLPYVPNELFFNDKNRDASKDGRIRIAYIGKLMKLYHLKDLQRIVETFRPLQNRIKLTFLTQGLGINDFQSSINTDYVEFKNFIPPWDMPSFYQKIDYITYFVKNNTLPDWSNIVPEALACGVKIITDDISFFAKFLLPSECIANNFIQIDLNDDPEWIYEKMSSGIARESSFFECDYAKYIEQNKKLYIDCQSVKLPFFMS